MAPHTITRSTGVGLHRSVTRLPGAVETVHLMKSAAYNAPVRGNCKISFATDQALDRSGAPS
jgi:hypothetical protein